MSSAQHSLVSRVVPLSGDRFELRNRLYQGCPTVACTRGGRLFAGWYSGGSREPSFLNYNIVAQSDDGGLTWRELFAIDGYADERLQSLDIEMFTDPRGRLWVCWVQRDWKLPNTQEGHLNEWAIVCDDPDADHLDFSEPRYLGEGFMRCQPTFLADGRWLLPAYNWRSDAYAYLESADQGQTFVERHAGRKVPTPFDEGMFLERRDGSLWMLARTNGKCLAQCQTGLDGATWGDGEPTDIPNPSTRFWLRRLPSGRVMLINNSHPSSRVNLTVSLSEDDGRTWCASLLLDPRDTSYPDAAITPDGAVVIVHDRGRCSFKEILVSRITEADVLAGRLVDHGSFQNHLVSKAPATPALGKWYRDALVAYDKASFGW